ncbi:MAG: magnesium transporter CorA [Lachnospiraceae bacterium]|nr:magnesium transporter CorA [Lachnospiraceae bacterium]
MYYLIKDTLVECDIEQCHQGEYQYVALLTSKEWQDTKDSFEMGIDLEPETLEIHNTKAEVNYDSLTGTFSIPDRKNITEDDFQFAFALDEKGIVFIDDSNTARDIIERVKSTRKWRMPSLERFLYDFLEQIVYGDLTILEKYERELDKIEDEILSGNEEEDLGRVYDIRNDLRDLKTHYDQLMDLAQELEENENNFFKTENVRYFHLFSNRVSRLYDVVTALRDYSVQLRDLYQSQLDVKQNRIMTVLTVVTTIFMPLTLIAGWYGMNFKYMPELETNMGYPVVIAVSLSIVIVSLIYFKKKKWL